MQRPLNVVTINHWVELQLQGVWSKQTWPTQEGSLVAQLVELQANVAPPYIPILWELLQLLLKRQSCLVCAGLKEIVYELLYYLNELIDGCGLQRWLLLPLFDLQRNGRQTDWERLRQSTWQLQTDEDRENLEKVVVCNFLCSQLAQVTPRAALKGVSLFCFCLVSIYPL